MSAPATIPREAEEATNAALNHQSISKSVNQVIVQAVQSNDQPNMQSNSQASYAHALSQAYSQAQDANNHSNIHVTLHDISSDDDNDQENEPMLNSESINSLLHDDNPFLGFYLQITDSFTYIINRSIKLVACTNFLAIILSFFGLFDQSSNSAASQSSDTSTTPIVTPSTCIPLINHSSRFSSIFISGFFDSSFVSFCASLFALFEAGRRYESARGSVSLALFLLIHFIINRVAYLTVEGYLGVELVSALSYLPISSCSPGAWPVIFALVVSENLLHPHEPRVVPLLNNVRPTLVPLICLLMQQIVFGVSLMVSLGFLQGYALHWPLMRLLDVICPACETRLPLNIVKRKEFVMMRIAGTLPPWKPLRSVIKRSFNRSFDRFGAAFSEHRY